MHVPVFISKVDLFAHLTMYYFFVASAVSPHDSHHVQKRTAENTISGDDIVFNRDPVRSTYNGVIGCWSCRGSEASDFRPIEYTFHRDKQTVKPSSIMTAKRGAPIIINPVSSYAQLVFLCDSSS